jgi:hypothetical protein
LIVFGVRGSGIAADRSAVFAPFLDRYRILQVAGMVLARFGNDGDARWQRDADASASTLAGASASFVVAACVLL